MIHIDDVCVQIKGSRIKTYNDLANLGRVLKSAGFSEGETMLALKVGYAENDDKERITKELMDESIKVITEVLFNDDTLPS